MGKCTGPQRSPFNRNPIMHNPFSSLNSDLGENVEKPQRFSPNNYNRNK